MNHRLLPALLLAAAVVSGCNKADESAGTPPAAQPPSKPAATAPAARAGAEAAGVPTSWPATTQPGHILAGDLLAVQVAGLTGAGTEPTFPKQVAADGTVSLPYLSKPLKLAGMTDAGAEQEISKAYHDENVINKSAVDVRRLRVAGTGGPAPAPIAKNDLLRIAIGDLTNPGSVTVRLGRVAGDGRIGLPYLEPLKVAGLTDQQVEVELVKAYHDQNIINHAMVSVLRLEAAPPEAGGVDLPDVAVQPFPEYLRWLYEPMDSNPSSKLQSH